MKRILPFLAVFFVIGLVNSCSRKVPSDETSKEISISDAGSKEASTKEGVTKEKTTTPDQKSQDNTSAQGACKIACGEEFTNSTGAKQCSRSECKQNSSDCKVNHECYTGSCQAGKCAPCRTMFDCEFYAICDKDKKLCQVRK